MSVKPLVNSADLPPPKRLKPGAKLRLCEWKVRHHLQGRDPKECKGKHARFGFNTRSYEPTAFASNQHNEYQALLARVLADTDQPVMGCEFNMDEGDPCDVKGNLHYHGKQCRYFDDELLSLPSCIRWAKKNHKVLFPNMHGVRSVPFQEYLTRSNASPSVKRVLRKTWLRMRDEGYDENSILTPTELYRWTTRSSFVKVENDLYHSPVGDKDKAPRLSKVHSQNL